MRFGLSLPNMGHVEHLVGGSRGNIKMIVNLQRVIAGLRGNRGNFVPANNMASFDCDDFVLIDVRDRDHATPGKSVVAYFDFR